MELQSKELRIGNLIYCDGALGKVTGLDSYGNIQWQGYYPLTKLEPIPLTEEILLKVGFVKGIVNTLINAYCLFSFYLTIHEDKLFYEWKGGNIEIKYLHQLQNLYFALTGKELNTAGLI